MLYDYFKHFENRSRTNNFQYRRTYPRLALPMSVSLSRLLRYSLSAPAHWLIQMRLSNFLFVTRLPSISRKLDCFIFFPLYQLVIPSTQSTFCSLIYQFKNLLQNRFDTAVVVLFAITSLYPLELVPSTLYYQCHCHRRVFKFDYIFYVKF